MTQAVVWYRSRAVLGAIATIIMAALSAFHLLPGLTKDQVLDFLVVAVPAAVALEGRISATKTIAATPARAAAASTNPSAAAPIDPPPQVAAPETTETDMKLAAPLAAAALLAGCATTGTAGTALLTTTKALTVAENAYQLAAAATVDAASTGLITPALAVQIKAANDKAVGLLDAAKAAQTTAEQATDAADAMTAIGELSALIPHKAN